MTRENDILDGEITDDDILNSLKSLRNGRAVGSDGTCIEMYKATIHITL